MAARRGCWCPGTIITPGRTLTYTYDYNDQPTSQTDDFGTPTNTADDERITFTYTPTGLEASKTIAKADGAGGWINEQQVTETYYANGLLKTLTTTDGGSPATTLSQHTLSYITAAGIYMDGNRVSDVLQLKGPDSTAPCYATACTASWQYDPRDRLTEEVNGTGTTVDYTLDVYGNSTQEKTNGTVTRTAIYTGLQLTSDTVSGVTHKYLYDSAGNLNCVVTTAWNGSGCPALYYGVAPDPSLVTYNLFDSKNRLAGTWTFNAGTQTDGAVYTLDSLDRVLSESEWHTGVSSRTDFTYIGLSDAVGQEQHYDGSGVLTETKSYVYDALGRPATLTDTPAGGATSRFSYVFDPHGSVELVLDQNRHVEAAYGYNAYGDSNLSLTKTAAGFSPNTNAFQFQSERYDTGSKTIDFGARHYNPALERFTQRDSYQAALDNLGLSTDPLNGNRYTLTGANPINFVDLDGHKAKAGNSGKTKAKGATARWKPSDDKPIKEDGTFWLVVTAPVGGLEKQAGKDAAKLAGKDLAKPAEEAGSELVKGGKSIVNGAKSLIGKIGGLFGSGAKKTTVGELRAAGRSDAHHIIQDAAVRDVPGYDTNAAPGFELPGPSTTPGTAHYLATQAQRVAKVGGTYGAERQVAAQALAAAGRSSDEVGAALKQADNYFMKMLGLTHESPLRIPGNRRVP